MMRDAASQRQVDAANPHTSTWLAANAGSGKTRVLTDRVARLLLDGVSPQNILCLTYTKAAAAEMQNRLFRRLGAWAMMEDDELRKNLFQLGVDKKPGANDLRAARTLFARAIETPGGLKIQTIHSFCSSVLRRFPLEAGVSPQFREMEDREASLLRDQVLEQLVSGPQSETVSRLFEHFTGSDPSAFLAEIAHKSGQFERDPTPAKIAATFGIDTDVQAEDLVADIFTPKTLDILRRLVDVCANGTSTEVKAANILRPLLAKNQFTISDVAVLNACFLYGESAKNPFGPKINAFPTKGTRADHPELTEDLNVLMSEVAEFRDTRYAILARDRTIAIHAFAREFLPAYAARKLAVGVLDFDDLISKTRLLLTDRNVAAWVLFRLDGGIDHLLVDEAQDTSPDQWKVVELLAEEFAAGEGAQPERRRTIFVVGDKKQSIYSFQGADPAAFDRMKDHFRKGHADIQKPFQITSLAHSFRSSQAVLSVVDATFSGAAFDGVEDGLQHVAFHETMPGRVDLWPHIEKSKEEERSNWFDPVDLPSETDHNVLLARRVARQISHMIAHETLPVFDDAAQKYRKRPITEGDILILVQSRSALFKEIIRACKSEGLNIAGADRLRVGAELAVKDLAALLSFLALPEDDLSLATALRSPLFGWTEQQLFTLAHHRPEGSYLWPALRDSGHTDTLAILHDLRSQSDFMRPYDLIERILTRHDGRRQLLARLGTEAEDGIDALLTQALTYETTGVPSLTGFLSWIETDELEIKRQMDNQGNKIRVMTVHGAKGLEAPIVFLPDTALPRNDIRDELLSAPDHLFWKPRKDDSSRAVMDLRAAYTAKQQQERMRLLYVAMTRAEKWLITAAAGNLGTDRESWYDIIAQGMERRGSTYAQSGDLQIKRVTHGNWDDLEMTQAPSEELAEVPPPVFGPVKIPETPKALSPSDLDGAKVLPGDPGTFDPETAKARGTQLHLLLEHLPRHPPSVRQSLGKRLVDAENEDLISDVERLLTNPSLAHLWSDDALTEVDLSADIAGLGRIHGTIDRLIMRDDSVLAIDYKSNRLVPASADLVPLGLLRQMGAYAAALGQIYPDQKVETAILWTESGKLMSLPNDVLHEALISVSNA